MSNLHGVIVSFNQPLPYPDKLYETGEAFAQVIENANVGIYDGHGSAEDDSFGDYFMFGPDADKLFEVIKPIIDLNAFFKGGSVFIRYGEGENAKTKVYQL